MNSTHRMSRRTWVALVALLVTLLAAPSAAHAWWRGGFGFGFGPVFVVPPPIYLAPPPVYFGPPPAAYPPGYVPGPESAGQACYAGQYVCPLDKPAAASGPCSCPTNDNGRIGGHVG